MTANANSEGQAKRLEGGAARRLPDNFHFLVLETLRQLEDAHACLEAPSFERFKRAWDRDQYVDLLKARIERHCFTTVRDAPSGSDRSLARLMALNVVTANLERIADYAVNLCKQTLFLHSDRVPRGFRFSAMFRLIDEGLEGLEAALRNMDVDAALAIARSERDLDRMFKNGFVKINRRLKKGRDPEDQLTMLFILRYLERMGDCLQNIGEAILSAAVGERFKLKQLERLEDHLASSGQESELDRLDLESFADTRSGNLTTAVRPGSSKPSAVFKEGLFSKISRERDGLRRWAEFRPGLAPEILEFRRHEGRASMLVQYLPGRTLLAHFINSPEGSGRDGLRQLLKLLQEIWQETRVSEPARPRFMAQLKRRMAGVRRLHPTLARHGQCLGGYSVPSLGDLLLRLDSLDRTLAAPFSVLTHGDLNLDNVLYHPDASKLHLLDVHRSAQQDWLQDLSVLMVSLLRLPLGDQPSKDAAARRMAECLAVGRDFAARQEDRSFESRLALGVARSCITSTRYIFDRELARQLFLKGLYLLERIPVGQAGAFRFPDWLLRRSM